MPAGSRDTAFAQGQIEKFSDRVTTIRNSGLAASGEFRSERVDTILPRRRSEDVARAAAPSGTVSVYHQAVFAELAKPFDDILLSAVYLDNKRPVEMMSVVTVVALGHYLGVKRFYGHDNDRTRLLFPLRHRPVD